MKIPKKFKLFATTINVEWDNKGLNDRSTYGESRYGESKIILSKTQGQQNLSKDKIMDVFYHEKVHIILNTLGYNDLSSDEIFVDTFAKLFRQSVETEEY